MENRVAAAGAVEKQVAAAAVEKKVHVYARVRKFVHRGGLALRVYESVEHNRRVA